MATPRGVGFGAWLSDMVLPASGRHEVRRVGGFKSGDRIFHQKFGYGTIQRVEDNKLAIAFDKAGDKMVMDSFVERA